MWETYLYKEIFERLKFILPDNHKGSNKLYIFKGSTKISEESCDFIEKNWTPRYPDYLYKDGDDIIIVADVKYRSYQSTGDRKNLNQLITYMYITKAQTGVLIYPIGAGVDMVKKDTLVDARFILR